MTIRFLGQSGYIVKTEKSEIMIDPYLSDSVNRVAGRPRTLPIPINPQNISCEAVICTHNHPDHLDPDTVAQINDEQFFITTNEGKIELNQLGKDHVVSLNVGESTVVGAPSRPQLLGTARGKVRRIEECVIIGQRLSKPV